MQRALPLIAISLLVLTAVLHWPFRYADADAQLSESRGPYTDEGLYTIQIRNYIHEGKLDITESDGLIKTPIFSFLQYFPLRMLGTQLPVARLAVTILLLLLLGYWITEVRFRWLLIFFLPVVLWQYQVFHFSHLALAEMISIGFILLALVLLWRSKVWISGEANWVFFSAAHAAVAIAWYVKVQFVYMAIWFPLLIGLYMISRILREKRITISLAKPFLLSMLLALSSVALYVFAWYLPNRTFFNYVKEHQVSERYEGGSQFWDRLDFNYEHYLWNDQNTWFIRLFFLALLIGVVMLVIRNTRFFNFIFCAALGWVMLELHKLPMFYLPTRYLLGLYVAGGLVIAIVLLELASIAIDQYKKRSLLTWVAAALAVAGLAWPVIHNGEEIYRSYHSRTWEIKRVNKLLTTMDFKGRPMAGPWAPAFSWENNVYSVPIWKDFLNDRDLFEKYNPRLLILEPVMEENATNKGIIVHLAAEERVEQTDTLYFKKWMLEFIWLK